MKFCFEFWVINTQLYDGCFVLDQGLMIYWRLSFIRIFLSDGSFVLRRGFLWERLGKPLNTYVYLGYGLRVKLGGFLQIHTLYIQWILNLTRNCYPHCREEKVFFSKGKYLLDWWQQKMHKSALLPPCTHKKGCVGVTCIIYTLCH
jgi:hypothetical protein